jgi:hypothetical protein
LDDYNYDESLSQLYRSYRHHLLHLPAGLASALGAVVAGAACVLAAGLLVASALGAALSSFFLANFISVFGASALGASVLAGAVASTLFCEPAGAAGVAATGVFAGCANADAIPKEAMIAIANDFILSFLYVNEVDLASTYI